MRSVLVLLAACAAPATAPAVEPVEPAKPTAILGYVTASPPDEDGFTRALAAHDEATLERLLSIDLPAFESRARGNVPAATLARLDAAWADAIARGAPMLMFDGTRGDQEILTASVMRVGVWVDDRFVPIGPPVKDAVGGWYDAAHGRAITVGLQVNDCKSDFCPRISLVRVEAWSPTAKLLGKLEVKTEEAHAVVVESGAQLRVQLVDCTVQGCRTPWQSLDGKPGDDEADRLAVDHRGTQLTLPHAGTTVRDATLVANDRSYALDKRHRVTELHCVAADPANAIVASTFDRCECDDGAAHVLMHQIDRVELATGALVEVAHGKGQAAIASGKSGVFVQRGNDRVERFASLADVGTSGAALPKGFLLLPPAGGRMCCGL